VTDWVGYPGSSPTLLYFGLRKACAEAAAAVAAHTATHEAPQK
jgi:hypothetical protein